MKAKSIIIILILLNLIIGNLILYGSHGKYETISGKLSIHSVFSIVAVLILVLSARFCSAKRNIFVVILLSVVSAFCIPTFSFYILFAGYGIVDLGFAVLLKGMPVSLLMGTVTWVFWLPLGMLNSIFYIAYSNDVDKR